MHGWVRHTGAVLALCTKKCRLLSSCLSTHWAIYCIEMPISNYRLGVNSFVPKPVDFQEFQEAVRQLGVYWLLLNQLPRGR